MTAFGAVWSVLRAMCCAGVLALLSATATQAQIPTSSAEFRTNGPADASET